MKHSKANQSLLETDMLGRIHACMNDYSVNLAGPVILGLSGGKDSLSLLFLLARMGLDVHPVIVDLGYKNFHAKEIAASVSLHGFKPEIVEANRPDTLVQLSFRSKSLIESNLAFLADPGNETPCGSCSQVKRTLLSVVAERKGGKWIVFGHHREDLLSTILKDYYAYYYHQEFGRFDYAMFKEFVQLFEIRFDLLSQLVEKEMAGTMGVRVPGEQVEIFRPMAYIEEIQTERYVKEVGAQTFGSGCAHESFLSGQSPTKREIVHALLKERLAANPSIGERLLEIALRSLDSQGRALFNPRAVRRELLPGFDSGS